MVETIDSSVLLKRQLLMDTTSTIRTIIRPVFQRQPYNRRVVRMYTLNEAHRGL